MLLYLGLDVLEFLGALGQALLQILEAGFGFGPGLLLGGKAAIQLVVGLVGLRELLLQLAAPGHLCFEGGGGLMGRSVGGVELLVLLLEMTPRALEVLFGLAQALLQFVELAV